MTLEEFRIETAGLTGNMDLYFISKIPLEEVDINLDSVEVSKYVDDIEIKTVLDRINLIAD